MEKFFREPINGFTHLFGALLSIVGLIAMIVKVNSSPLISNNFALALTSVIIFGVSLILLYTASATYHLAKASDKILSFLRRLDHSMIFILIGGSYMPFCLLALDGTTRIIFTTAIAALTLGGVLFKMIWFKCPRWISTALYIGMGWMAVFVIYPLYTSISFVGVSWLIGGGILYTIGGIIYGAKPKFLTFKHLGFHEIFHIFILLGSLAHFFCIFTYVLN
ncbi:hemolysin III [Clostridium cavendishii DSM 21758]|uniref:Hemolysin III n=1 Tax=Clostridium cavendishii DSM 21758 TaxID=1121302 RepID=A0A1M6CW20_9CLOT|nr:hemolysin III family protein [Clostridium cavendishii]SHI64928.1 hemolysin III [Clostridium cavendishii DSM 21758]